MESSIRKLVRHYRGLVTLAITAPFVVLGTLAWVVMGSISSAHGYVPAPYLNCVNNSQANLSALERSLAPTNSATAQVGALVAFTGNSEVPLRFSVASSPALLSNPDIDSGPGSAQPFSSREPNVDTYTFTSTRAAITPGAIYWDASFSSATIAECSGLTPTTYTTAIRTLTILPAPALPAPTPPTSPSPGEPPHLKVDISVTGSFHLAHPAVTYRIHCTAGCSGETSYQAFVLRRHARVIRASKLDLGSEPVSITAPAGGAEQFTQIYSGNMLPMFRAIARADGILEFRITVKVTGAPGNVARAQRTARIRIPITG